MDKPVLEFKNGDDIHFNYSNQLNLPPNSQEYSLSVKKKKKRKKKKSGTSGQSQQFSLGDATLNDPDADYPESRVIKLDSKGNVVVESLHDEYHTECMHSTHESAPVDVGESAQEFSLFHFNNDDERNFWTNLPQQEKSEIVNVDPHTIMEKFQQQIKTHRNMVAGDQKTTETVCNCTYCGRNTQYIEEELEGAYREYLDEIVDYIQSVKPDVLETMRHSDFEAKTLNSRTSPQQLDEIPKREISPRSDELNEKQTVLDTSNSKSSSKNTSLGHETLQLSPQELALAEKQDASSLSVFKDENRLRFKEMCEEGLRMEEELRSRLMFAKGLRKELMDRYKDTSKIPQYLLETLNFVDTTSPAIERSMELLSNLGDVFTGDVSEDKVLQASDEINVFAELILKNDGRSFVDIVETLMRQEKEKKRIEEVEDDNPELEHYALKSPADIDSILQNEGYSVRHSEPHSHVHNHADHHVSHNHHQNHHEHNLHHDQFHDDHDNNDHENNDHEDENNDEEEYASEYDDDYDYHHNHNCEHHDYDCHHDCDHDDHYAEESEDESDEESEYSKQKRIEEVRGFFMIQAVSLIRQKFREAYEKKISEDRTQKFIKELEAEENAKKEKELKKLKQKEKQKEKKRLQQLQKEEERKRKEAEELEKAAELKRKQEELRAEQMRRKEEIRLKKEEEKLRKIEALKKKELEHQKINEEKAAKQQEEERKKEAEEKAAKQKASELQEKLKSRKDLSKGITQLLESNANKEPSLEQLSVTAPSQLANDLTAPLSDPVTTNNHLLDQLYQARPRSASSTSSFTQSQQLSTLPGSIYSPTKQSPLKPPLEQSVYPSWGPESGANLLSLQLATQGNNCFSPFVDSATGYTDQWASNQIVDPFLNSKPVLGNRASASGSSVWGGGFASRNNSIWTSNPSVATSGTTMWASPVPQNAGVMAVAPPSLGGDVVHDANSIQAATYDAFHALQNSNQLTFGMAPAIQLFQTAKTLLNHSNLGMAEFLSTLRTGGRYQFDFLYDDFGSVTHIKVSSLNTSSTPPLSVSMRPPMQSQFLAQMQPKMLVHVQPQAPLQLSSTLKQPLLSFQQTQQQPGLTFQQSTQPPDDRLSNYDISLPGSVSGLLNQLGFGQSRGGIW